MKLLDLFCCAGGCGMGYHRAGFEVVGVDIRPQPRYPFEFHQGDALEYCREHWREFDAIHASPPCPRYANVTKWRGNQSDHPDLLPETREILNQTGRPWVIENVENAPMRPDLILCGTSFGLRIRRHRWFETNIHITAFLPPCDHTKVIPFMHKAERAFADAMGCTWMSGKEGRQAIPPAYTEFIGRHLMAHLLEAKAA